MEEVILCFSQWIFLTAEIKIWIEYAISYNRFQLFYEEIMYGLQKATYHAFL